MVPEAVAPLERKKRFVCVLYCDIDNYTNLVADYQHGDDIQQALKKCAELFVSNFRGKEGVYYAVAQGMEMVAVFSNATAALRYARAFQVDAEKTPSPNLASPVKLRMGLHSGDEDAETGFLSIAGGPIGAIANHIKDAATGGEILVSSALAENISATLNREFLFDQPRKETIGGRSVTAYLVADRRDPTLWRSFNDWICKIWESLTKWERSLALLMALLISLTADFLYGRWPEIEARAAATTSQVEILTLAGGKEAALLKREAVIRIGNWFARTPPDPPPPPGHSPPQAPPPPPFRPPTVCDVVSPPKDDALRACANDLESCKAKAAEGEPDAEAELGTIYLLGFGSVTKDERQSRTYATFAASHRNPVGEYTLGEIELKGSEKNLADALNHFSEAKDYPPAKDELGYMYFNGIGTGKDEREAVKLYQEAAGKSDAMGENSLAYAYLHGFGGLPVDCGKAYTYSVQAAGQGNAQALDTLGYLYETGHCAAVAAKNPSLALYCYQQAGELGFTMSQWHAGQILELRAPEEKDRRRLRRI